jgi:hypothetical protein
VSVSPVRSACPHHDHFLASCCPFIACSWLACVLAPYLSCWQGSCSLAARGSCSPQQVGPGFW